MKTVPSVCGAIFMSEKFCRSTISYATHLAPGTSIVGISFVCFRGHSSYLLPTKFFLLLYIAGHQCDGKKVKFPLPSPLQQGGVSLIVRAETKLAIN